MTTTANLKDVAKIAGVSVSTVSRALNGKNCVNEETKKKDHGCCGADKLSTKHHIKKSENGKK